MGLAKQKPDGLQQLIFVQSEQNIKCLSRNGFRHFMHFRFFVEKNVGTVENLVFSIYTLICVVK